MSATLQIDRAILEAALAGYELQREQIEAMVIEIHRQLGGRTSPATASAATAGGAAKRTVSAAARKRMAAAQRRRWAASRKAEQPAPAPKKRTLSATARKRIGQATKK